MGLPALGGLPVLSAAIFLPLVGAGAILLGRGERFARELALGTTLAVLAVCGPLVFRFDKSNPGMQFIESRTWIPSWNISYALGVDGIACPFILLAALLSVLSVLASWTAVKSKVPEFFAALLLAETAMIGLFAARDLFLFYVFWELMIVPMFLLIGVWGGVGRVYAAVKFLLFTLAGSVLMLIGLVVLHQAGGGTLDLHALAASRLPPALQAWLFLAFFAAFAVKVPMFPLHTWLPDAHTEAPTAGSVILAGILLKMGAYGFIRVSLPLFPDATRLFLKPMLALSAVAIVYGAYVTLTQTDIKKLIAYSSVSHMGFVTLGLLTLNRSGLEGAILQMVNHGIVTGALFLCVGLLYERTHSREISDYGGLFKAVPIYTTFLALFCLAASGMPGLNSFIGEFLIIGAAFKVNLWLGAAAVWGVALGATYMLWLYYRVAMGALKPRLKDHLRDLNAREVLALAPLAALALALGLHPESVLGYLHVPVGQLLSVMAAVR